MNIFCYSNFVFLPRAVAGVGQCWFVGVSPFLLIILRYSNLITPCVDTGVSSSHQDLYAGFIPGGKFSHQVLYAGCSPGGEFFSPGFIRRV